MFKLSLEKTEEPEIKLTTSVGSSKSKRIPEKISTSASLTTLKPLLCGLQQTEKFSKRWEYQTTLIASWESCSKVKKQVRAGHGTDWFQIGKGVHQDCVFSPCWSNFYAEYIMKNAGLDEAQTGTKIAGRNINNLGYADDTTLMAKSNEKLKSLWIKMKQESEKAGLKLSIQKMKSMASGPITSWQIDGETMETVTGIIFLDFKINADGDSNHKIKRCLLLGRKAMTNIDNMLKSRNITFLKNRLYSQNYGFSSN